jgi:hypothetical protein
MYVYPYPIARQVAANVRTLDVHQEKIEANQQDIRANRQQIEQNIQDIQENTDRLTALAEYEVKDQAILKFKVGSAKIATEDI